MSETASINIGGMQKLTLLDYPSIPACTLFTSGCNFACPYCHNPELIPFADGQAGFEALFGEDYIFDFLKGRKGLLDGVCISGGEPLAQEGISHFVREVKRLGFSVKIDTNGSYPDRLARLVEDEGIDYVAMDVKNTLPKYPETVGVPGYDTAPVKESIDYLLRGKVSYEFRTTVVRELHAAEDIMEIARLIKGAARYFLQTYAEREGTARPKFCSYNAQELQALCALIKELLPCAELRGV